ncbi:(2Fe-2S)-binding protein [Salsuginibacillus kocurii]|uniref:(2Fe-2S)-binding protein n=1 Tax=Salsuginibacillus kocurii TaxID=427078 RepID=UPI00037A7D15|nr:(2Fe-2S)-binding protein [Salsuginibacillus kocurii]
MILCRCEEVTYETVRATKEKYQCDARELKLRTRAGMGYCGGRVCRPLLDKISQNKNERLESQVIPLKYQPPVRPITFQRMQGDHHG